jgi:recombination protein RecR
MNNIDKLTEYFSKFPGIGPRQAKRFVYFLLTRNQNYITELTSLISHIKNDVKECTSCHRFFEVKNGRDETLCDICRNPARDASVLAIVARDIDLENIEKTRSFSGLYFVLGGSIPILEKNPEQRVRQNALLQTIEQKGSQNILKEIIVAMNLTPEGENTGEYVETMLRPITDKYKIKISHLGKGISTGTELEYSDSDTLKNALKNRS